MGEGRRGAAGEGATPQGAESWAIAKNCALMAPFYIIWVQMEVP